ncbi:S8 family serine peptidase [Frigoribacterium sp. ME-P-080]|uniref:S8 family serine peptidase n=1 Tax=Frigoribacterium sp. ME-P-080 TaxID=3040289 RepID=UPI00254EA996|nr:S8 family serine peptidase [Frigoribacterium sp. ME-P-080]
MTFTDPRARGTRRRVTTVCLAASLTLGLVAVGSGAAVAAPPASAPGAPAAPGKPGPAPTLPVVEGPVMNYVVNAGKANPGATKQVERAVAAAGGSVIAAYAELGVVVAQSSNANFAPSVRSDKAVSSAGATRTAAVAETDPTYGVGTTAPGPGKPVRPGHPGGPGKPGGPGHPGKPKAATSPEQRLEEATTVVADPLEAQQWDLTAIGADQAHQVTDGSRDVLVAVLDSGIEGDHPDLQPNIDVAASASCLTGTPDSSYAAWQPTTSDHGTHVAGTIAAARNGVGIVGVAPGVTMSAVKVVSDDGFIYPEAAICGFMQAAATGADITNNSYYVDPWQFWCGSDVDQAAVLTAVDRAVQFTQKKGIVNVAAAGNSSIDLANKTVDTDSPNDTMPTTRPIDSRCLDIPTELDGVVTVSSTTSAGAKSGFSNYGEGVVDVAAPGSAILSTVTGGGYGTKSGTSMASPHVAGVLALLKSTHPRLGGTALVGLLERQATDTPCPTGTTTCTGTPADNGWFGEGIVDALAAVTK